MDESKSENVSGLERLLAENNIGFRRVEGLEGNAAGCSPPATVFCPPNATAVCVGTTCHQTAIIVALE
jgi:hypothetical protein